MNKDNNIRTFIKTFFETLKLASPFTPPSDLEEDLGVKKGLINGIKYLIFIFLTFPLMILNQLLKINYATYRFLERFVLATLFIIRGEGINTLSEVYQRYLKSIVNKVSVIEPSIDTIQYIINYYRVFRLLVAVLFFAIIIFVLKMTYLIFVFAFSTIFSAPTTAIGLLGGGQGFVYALAIKGLLIIIALILFWIIFSHVIYAGLKVVILSIKSFNYVDRADFSEFLTVALDYTYEKAVDIYGEEVAKEALFLLLENYTSKKDVFDFGVDDIELLELKKEFLEKKENK